MSTDYEHLHVSRGFTNTMLNETLLSQIYVAPLRELAQMVLSVAHI